MHIEKVVARREGLTELIKSSATHQRISVPRNPDEKTVQANNNWTQRGGSSQFVARVKRSKGSSRTNRSPIQSRIQGRRSARICMSVSTKSLGSETQNKKQNKTLPGLAFRRCNCAEASNYSRRNLLYATQREIAVYHSRRLLFVRISASREAMQHRSRVVAVLPAFYYTSEKRKKTIISPPRRREGA